MLRALPSFERQKRSSTPPKLQDDSSTADTVLSNIPTTSAGSSTAVIASKRPSFLENPLYQDPTNSSISSTRVPNARLGPSKIADRIRSINDLQGLSRAPVHLSTSISSPHLRHKVSATTAGRALPFVRRDATAAPSSTDRTLDQATERLIHSPTPTRHQPELSRRMETGANTSSPQEEIGPHQCLDHRNRDTVQAAQYAASRPMTQDRPVPGPDAAHGHVVCSRHGRNLAPRRKQNVTTTEGLERSISGAYIPIGHRLRHQVDVLSPWTVFGRCLAKQDGTTVSPEICPDCAAEHDILNRELSESSQPSTANRASANSEGTSLGPSSTITERGTPSS